MPRVNRGAARKPFLPNRNRAATFLVIVTLAGCSAEAPNDTAGRAQVALGEKIYSKHCAACHGANLEGQPNWRERLPTGRLPAPPHDASGHTWHHADEVLFDITKHGLAKHAPPGYRSDMPAYAGVLSDGEIRAVLAFIKSRWPEPVREKQAKITGAHRASK